MIVPSEPKLIGKKSGYYLSEEKYIRRRGKVTETETEIVHRNDDENTVLLDLLRIDLNKPEDIIDFCNKYGRLGIAHPFCIYEPEYPLEFFHNDIDGKMPKDLPDNPEDTYNYQAPETIRSYKIYIQVIKAILALQEAIQTKNYAKICDRALFLLSTFEGFTAVPDALFDLDNEILNECKKYVTWPEPIGADMDTIYETGSRYTFDFEPWLSGELSYEKEFSIDAFVGKWSQKELEDMLYDSQKLIAAIITRNVRTVRFTLDVTPSGEIQDGWSADSLSAIIYCVLYVNVSRAVLIKICANKTCVNPFVIYGDDTRKIYCCERCGKIEAKRSYRARGKAKSVEQ